MKMDTQRKELFNFYQEFDSPILNITVDFKFKNVLTALKSNKISFFQYMVFNICKTCLEEENFSTRFDGKNIYKIKRLVPSYTVLRKTGNFNFCTFDYSSVWSEFLSTSLGAKQKAEEANHLILDDHTHRDYIFITCLPWFNFTSIQHPVGQFKDSTIPSFAIGQYRIDDDEVSIPLSIQVHHGLVDGIHISQFLEKLKFNIENLSCVKG